MENMELKTPYAELLLPLSSDEYNALKSDIELHGIVSPIIVDEEDSILDGHHRYKIAVSLGKDVPTRVIEGLKPYQKKAYVWRSNLARRNMSPDQKAAILKDMKEVALDMKRDGMTQEAIAAEFGVSDSTVSGWIISNSNTGITYNSERLDNRVKLFPEDKEEIIERYSDGVTQSQIAADFGVTQPKISQVVTEAKKKLTATEWSKVEPKIDEAESMAEKLGVKYGQVWELGNHILVCGDSTNMDILFLACGGEIPDAIIADPPYGMNLDTDYSKMPSTKPEGNKEYSPIVGDDRPFDYQDVILHSEEEFWFGADYYRKSIPDGGSWLVWDKRVDENFDAMIGSAFELIWSKRKHKREIIRHNNTLFSGEAEAKNKLHPTIKPITVIDWIIERYTAKGQLIVDLYAGSGTIILACENTGRRCIAIEIEPKYVAVALDRFATATSIAPKLRSE